MTQASQPGSVSRSRGFSPSNFPQFAFPSAHSRAQGSHGGCHPPEGYSGPVTCPVTLPALISALFALAVPAPVSGTWPPWAPEDHGLGSFCKIPKAPLLPGWGQHFCFLRRIKAPSQSCQEEAVLTRANICSPFGILLW